MKRKTLRYSLRAKLLSIGGAVLSRLMSDREFEKEVVVRKPLSKYSKKRKIEWSESVPSESEGSDNSNEDAFDTDLLESFPMFVY